MNIKKKKKKRTFLALYSHICLWQLSHSQRMFIPGKKSTPYLVQQYIQISHFQPRKVENHSRRTTEEQINSNFICSDLTYALFLSGSSFCLEKPWDSTMLKIVKPMDVEQTEFWHIQKRFFDKNISFVCQIENMRLLGKIMNNTLGTFIKQPLLLS